MIIIVNIIIIAVVAVAVVVVAGNPQLRRSQVEKNIPIWHAAPDVRTYVYMVVGA